MTQPPHSDSKAKDSKPLTCELAMLAHASVSIKMKKKQALLVPSLSLSVPLVELCVFIKLRQRGLKHHVMQIPHQSHSSPPTAVTNCDCAHPSTTVHNLHASFDGSSRCYALFEVLSRSAMNEMKCLCSDIFFWNTNQSINSSTKITAEGGLEGALHE